MKKLIIILSIIILASCGATRIQTPPLDIETTENIPDQSKKEICTKARDYIALNFVDSNKVLKISDVENGNIIGQAAGIVFEPMLGGMPVKYTVDIKCKDNKIKIHSFNFIMTYPARNGYGPHDYELHNNTFFMYQDVFAKGFTLHKDIVDFIMTDMSDEW